MIQAVLFDFFDVIHCDHQKAWLAANGFKREGGFANASDQLDRGEIDFERYLQLYGELSGKSSDQVRREFASYDSVDAAVVDIIERLHRTQRTALISNAHSDELRPILQRYNLERLFDEIHISSEVGIAKPDPEIFRHAARSLQVELENCVFVDDNPSNVAAATKIGMQGLVFTDAATLTLQLQQLGLAI